MSKKPISVKQFALKTSVFIESPDEQFWEYFKKVDGKWSLYKGTKQIIDNKGKATETGRPTEEAHNRYLYFKESGWNSYYGKEADGIFGRKVKATSDIVGTEKKILIYDPQNKLTSWKYFLWDGNKYYFTDPKHLSGNTLLISFDEARKKISQSKKPSSVILTGSKAHEMAMSLKRELLHSKTKHKPTTTNKKDETSSRKPATAAKTQIARKPATSPKKPTAHKTIKGKEGYSLIERKKKGYCVPETKQTYWKRL